MKPSWSPVMVRTPRGAAGEVTSRRVVVLSLHPAASTASVISSHLARMLSLLLRTLVRRWEPDRDGERVRHDPGTRGRPGEAANDMPGNGVVKAAQRAPGKIAKACEISE